ncbi:hypothetical protein GCM10011349_24020 [Novosphingobium indicum]|uniref:Uncharacterized protein n=1 Tax=Novosphingobium indicum TaxID=462949 RepID=A0ABQ2JRC8_9SPHN|nr:hypothetical protein GCM10011349_24020 [Novosphingobium indicum]
MGCALEATQQDARSAGTVDDVELICRAAYSPFHFKKGKIQASIIKANDLFAGTLSVWRASEKANCSVQDVAGICAALAPKENTTELRALTAQRIRAAARPDIGGRLFCVVDETDTDDQGGSHPAHAHIKVCSGVLAGAVDTNDPKFQIAKSELAFLLRQSDAKVVSAPTPPVS